MAQLKFYRRAQAPTSPVEGAIWFNTADKTIQIYAGNTWEKYAGNLKDATWSGSTLTITKHDGSSIALDFSDMASAATMGKIIAAAGLNNDGTFKKNATNYGGSATTIGGEIANIDSALKTLDGTVSTNYTTLDGKIDSSINSIKGTLGEDDAKTLEAINDELDHLSSSIGNLGNMVAKNYVRQAQLGAAVTTLKGTSSDTKTSETIYGAKAYALDLFGNLGNDIAPRVEANENAIAALKGNDTTEGSVDKKIKDAINDFATKATDNGTIDTFKELVDYVAGVDGSATLANAIAQINSNKGAIETLNGDNTVAGSVDKKVKDAIDAEVTRANGAYATKAQGEKADSAVQSVTEGTANGTIAVDGTDVAIHGLGSAAYKAEGDFATAAQGALADAAAPKSTTYTKTEVDTMLSWAEFE